MLNPNNDLINLINVLSFIVGMENLNENRQQAEHNDVQTANDRQAQYLLQEIDKRFDEQNKQLADIAGILEKMLEALQYKP